jgi:hypothetical protein
MQTRVDALYGWSVNAFRCARADSAVAVRLALNKFIWRGNMFRMLRRHILLLIAFIGLSAPAHAEMQYFLCRNNDIGGLYVAIDLDRKLAKLSAEPADDRDWSSVKITSSMIRWSEITARWKDRNVLNRFSLTLNIYHENTATGSHNLTVLRCERSEQPRRKI